MQSMPTANQEISSKRDSAYEKLNEMQASIHKDYEDLAEHVIKSNMVDILRE